MIETNRCKLYKLQEADYEDVKHLYLDDEVRKYLGGRVEEGQYKSKFQEMIESKSDEWHWVVRVNGSMDFVGLVSLDVHADGIGTEISYQLLPKWWRNGYGKEVLKRVIEFAFKELDLETLVAETQSANIPSCKLLESVGMNLENRVVRFGANQNIYRLSNAVICRTIK